jgi:hypothetical protein
VSLDIIKALIQSCHRDLNLFSKHVIDILDMIMDTRDLDLIDIACGTVMRVLPCILGQSIESYILILLILVCNILHIS